MSQAFENLIKEVNSFFDGICNYKKLNAYKEDDFLTVKNPFSLLKNKITWAATSILGIFLIGSLIISLNAFIMGATISMSLLLGLFTLMADFDSVDNETRESISSKKRLSSPKISKIPFLHKRYNDFFKLYDNTIEKLKSGTALRIIVHLEKLAQEIELTDSRKQRVHIKRALSLAQNLEKYLASNNNSKMYETFQEIVNYTKHLESEFRKEHKHSYLTQQKQDLTEILYGTNEEEKEINSYM